MLGASAGRRRGSTRRTWVDSARVSPATLAEGVGGNGRTAPSSAACVAPVHSQHRARAETHPDDRRVLVGRIAVPRLTGVV